LCSWERRLMQFPTLGAKQSTRCGGPVWQNNSCVGVVWQTEHSTTSGSNEEYWREPQIRLQKPIY